MADGFFCYVHVIVYPTVALVGANLWYGGLLRP